MMFRKGDKRSEIEFDAKLFRALYVIQQVKNSYRSLTVCYTSFLILFIFDSSLLKFWVTMWQLVFAAFVNGSNFFFQKSIPRH